MLHNDQVETDKTVTQTAKILSDQVGFDLTVIGVRTQFIGYYLNEEQRKREFLKLKMFGITS